MLLNLQSNAIKFTQEGYVRIVVTMRPESILFMVVDTGVGISLDNQRKLFKLFGFIKDTQSMNINGIGLGLMITQKLAL